MADTPVDIVPLIRSGDFAKLRDELIRWTPQELASALSELRADDQVLAFRILPRRARRADGGIRSGRRPVGFAVLRGTLL